MSSEELEPVRVLSSPGERAAAARAAVNRYAAWKADPRAASLKLSTVPPWAAEHRALRDALGNVENHTSEFALDDAPSNVPTALALERDAREDDAQRLRQRQKQIDLGKNTRGYERYVALVPRDQRKFDDPWTPDKTAPCSKRAFDGRIRKWRRDLHKYDEEADGWR